MPLIVSFLVALLLAPLAAYAQVIHACVKPNGNLQVVAGPTSCANNETPLSWNVQGPQGEPGTPGEPGTDGEPGAQGPPGPTLHVFDVNGRDLGLLAASDPVHLRVFVPGVGEVPAVRYTGAVPEIPVFFADPECTGQAYLDDIYAGIAGVDQRGLQYYVGSTGETDSPIETAYIRDATPACRLAGGGLRGIPATEITAEDIGVPWPGPLYVGLPPE